MFRKTKDPLIDFLAVEVAVKLHAALEEGNESPVYEYIGESKQIVAAVFKNPKMPKLEIAEIIAKVFSESLEHGYQANDFLEVADFVSSRMQHFKRYSLI